MDELKKARKEFVNAYITAQGHINWEFQYSRNRAKSTEVAERNTAEVRKNVAKLNDVCDKRMAELKEQIDEITMMKHRLREMSYYPKTSSYGLEDSFPEIEKGLDKYGDRYLDRKYRRK